MKEHFPATLKFLSKFKPKKKISAEEYADQYLRDYPASRTVTTIPLPTFDLKPGETVYLDDPGSIYWKKFVSKQLMDTLYPVRAGATSHFAMPDFGPTYPKQQAFPDLDSENAPNFLKVNTKSGSLPEETTNESNTSIGQSPSNDQS